MSHPDTGPEPRLVAMANQIGLFFASQRHRDAGQAVAEHLRKFWTPIMREQIRDHLARGGEGLNDAARAGVQKIDALQRAIPAGHDDDSSEHAHPAVRV
jgi:formate dehydrogenase subunit delta